MRYIMELRALRGLKNFKKSLRKFKKVKAIQVDMNQELGAVRRKRPNPNHNPTIPVIYLL